MWYDSSEAFAHNIDLADRVVKIVSHLQGAGCVVIVTTGYGSSGPGTIVHHSYEKGESDIAITDLYANI